MTGEMHVPITPCNVVNPPHVGHYSSIPLLRHSMPLCPLPGLRAVRLRKTKPICRRPSERQPLRRKRVMRLPRRQARLQNKANQSRFPRRGPDRGVGTLTEHAPRLRLLASPLGHRAGGHAEAIVAWPAMSAVCGRAS